MAMVQAPRARVLQQTAGHRRRAVDWHAPLGRHRVRRALPRAVRDRADFRAAAAFLRPRGYGETRSVRRPRRHRHTAAVRRRGADDGGLPLRALLDVDDAERLASRSVCCAPCVAAHRPLAWAGLPLKEHQRLPTRLFRAVLRAFETRTRPPPHRWPVARARHHRTGPAPAAHLECTERLGDRRAPAQPRRPRAGMEVHAELPD